MRKREDPYKFIGAVLDAYDLLPEDVKDVLRHESLGRILERRLQLCDLGYTVTQIERRRKALKDGNLS